MKNKLSLLFLLYFPILVLYNCQKEEQKEDDLIRYRGKENTLREYETNIWRFEPRTDIPYYKIAESLYKKLLFDSALISKGLVSNDVFSETLVPYDITWNRFKDTNLIKNILVSESDGVGWRLDDNLQCIADNEKYTLCIVGGGGEAWYEDHDELSFYFRDTLKHIFLAKPLHVGNKWIRESRKLTLDGEHHVFQQECTCISQEIVHVKAGDFSAFKIEVMNHWVNLNSKSLRQYEYYVPNIGMILFETDGTINQAIISPSGEAVISVFREKVRKELVSYRFIK